MSRPTLKKGSKGDDVTDLQKLLLQHGRDVGSYGADGDFGGGTDTAVRQFQASENLGVDGIVGKMTWAALEGSEGTSDTPTEAPTSEKDKLREKIPDGISDQRRAVLMSAISDLGKSEQGSSNWSPEIAHLVDGYNEFWKTGSTDHYPWCAMACSVWIGIGCGKGSSGTDMEWKATPIKKFYGGASQYEDLGKQDGCWVEETEEAPAGSVFTMARGGSGSDPSQAAKAGHVGIIICDNGDGTVTTIEGNVSDKVKSYNREKKDLHGFVTWWE